MSTRIKTTCSSITSWEDIRRVMHAYADAVQAGNSSKTKTIKLFGSPFTVYYNGVVSNLQVISAPNVKHLEKISLDDPLRGPAKPPCETTPKCCSYPQGSGRPPNYLQEAGDHGQGGGVDMIVTTTSPEVQRNSSAPGKFSFDVVFTATNYTLNGTPDTFTEKHLYEMHDIPVIEYVKTTTVTTNTNYYRDVKDCYPYPCT